jgi:hypothetical protein
MGYQRIKTLAIDNKIVICASCWRLFRGPTLGPLAPLSQYAISCSRRASTRLIHIPRVAWPIPNRAMKSTEEGEQSMSQKASQDHSRMGNLRPLAFLLAAWLSVPALAQSVPFPTYTPGPQTNGTFVVSDGTVITPSGTVVNLGIRTRAKSIALNPTGNNTAAVLQMGAAQVVTVFNTKTGAVLQTFNPTVGAGGSSVGITYTPDGKYLLFSQDGDYGLSYVAVASVSSTGTLTNFANIAVPPDVDATGKMTTASLALIPIPRRSWRDLRPRASALREPMADSIFHAPTPFRCSPMRRPLPIRWASRSRPMPRPPT